MYETYHNLDLYIIENNIQTESSKLFLLFNFQITSVTLYTLVVNCISKLSSTQTATSYTNVKCEMY